LRLFKVGHRSLDLPRGKAGDLHYFFWALLLTGRFFWSGDF